MWVISGIWRIFNRDDYISTIYSNAMSNVIFRGKRVLEDIVQALSKTNELIFPIGRQIRT